MNGDCINYNCDTLEDHESFGSGCAPVRQAGFDGIVLILCGNDVLDPTSGTEVNQMITDGDAKKVLQVAFGIDSSDPVLSTIAATPCSPFRVLYVNYNGSGTDIAFTQQNMDFWTTLTEGFTVGGAIFHMCNQDGFDDLSMYIDGEVTFAGGPVNTKDGSDTARFELTWTTRKKPEIIATPVGVFS